MKPRKHAELIKQWADGAVIQYLNLSGNWVECDVPMWNETVRYRLKPEKTKFRVYIDSYREIKILLEDDDASPVDRWLTDWIEVENDSDR
jgi:hypothetical protein